VSVVPAPLPTTVDGIIDRLRTIQRSLSPTDGVGVFNGIYLDVTKQVAASIKAEAFADTTFMTELDIRFANLWISAYDAAAAGRRPPWAWRAFFDQRRTTGVLPIQYALAGMNAHIEHDLPLAVVETCRALRTSPSVAAVRQDYEEVNDVLAGVEAGIRRSFLTAVGQRVDDEIGPLVHLVSAWNIDKARDVAWVHVETLWTLRDLGRLRDRYVAMLGHTVGMASRILVTPVSLAGFDATE
jgi:Family of unknown function (DUF5995)